MLGRLKELWSRQRRWVRHSAYWLLLLVVAALGERMFWTWHDASLGGPEARARFAAGEATDPWGSHWELEGMLGLYTSNGPDRRAYTADDILVGELGPTDQPRTALPYQAPPSLLGPLLLLAAPLLAWIWLAKAPRSPRWTVEGGKILALAAIPAGLAFWSLPRAGIHGHPLTEFAERLYGGSGLLPPEVAVPVSVLGFFLLAGLVIRLQRRAPPPLP